MLDKNYILHLIFIVFLSMIMTSISYGQLFETDESSNTITIKCQDSVIEITTYTGNIKNGFKNDVEYFWYSSNQIHKNFGGYSGKLLHGDYRVFDSNKALITKGSFNKGVKEGSWKTWYWDGAIKTSLQWENGKMNGKCIWYKKDTTIIKYYHAGIESGTENINGSKIDNILRKLKVHKDSENENQGLDTISINKTISDSTQIKDINHP